MTTVLPQAQTEKTPGSVVTFYSFKGGVGRSMALANIAVLLARAGKKVLCLDWDLEAPGLDRYFSAVPVSNPSQVPMLLPPAKPGGLLDILQISTPDCLAPWRDYLRNRESADGRKVKLDFIGSGDDAPDYSSRLADFNWATFFAEQRGVGIIEALRKEWKAAYDFVLVDSRTGLTDASGICTIQMPDVLVLLFAANQQNVDWCGRVADGIRKGRRALPYDRSFLPIVPVLARFDGSEESDRAAAAKARIAERFDAYFQEWLPRGIAPREMLNWSVLPYVPRYSFEEALAVEDEPPSGALGLSFYYDLLAKLILSRFQDVRGILAGVGVPGAALPPLLPSATELRQELRRDSGAAVRYRQSILNRAEETPLEAVDALETLAQALRPAEAEALLADAIALLQDSALAEPDEVPRLMTLRADALAASGRVQEAELLCREAIELAQTLFGAQDAHTAQTQVALARFLERQDRKDEAAQYYALAVEAYDFHAADNPSALRDSLEAWRGLLNELGRWPEMLPVAKRVWELTAADSDSSLSDRALALDRYASALRSCGQYTEAVELFQQVLKLEEQATSGTNTLAVSRALNNLARVLRDTGRYAEAEPLYRRSSAIAEKALGPEHPDVAASCSNLARVLRATGRYAEAEPLSRRALAIAEKALGPEHPDVATACGNLAGVLRVTGRYAEVEPLYRRALAIHEKSLGLEHPNVATSCGNLAGALRDTGRYAEAESLYRRALVIYEKSLGLEHPNVATACCNLAMVMRDTGRYTEAESLYRRALAIYEKSLGLEHPNVATACGNLAGVLSDTGRYAEVEPLCRRALAIHEKSLGLEHPNVAMDCCSFAGVLSDTGRYAEAEQLYRRAVAIYEKSLGLEHPNVATACGNLAGVLRDTGRYAEAEQLYRRALAIFEKALGLEHPYLGIGLVYFAQTLSEAGELTEAEGLWQRGLRHLEKNFGTAHDRNGRALWHYAEHLQRCGQTAAAREAITQALVILEQALGAEHPDTQRAKQTASSIGG